VQFAIHWLWEMSLTACLFTWALVLALRLRRIGEPEEVAPKPGRDLALWAVFGLLWGLTALSNASLVLCLPVWILWILWPQKNQPSHPHLIQSVPGAALACLVVVATMTPWIARNERAFHAFVPTRSNFGVELWQSTLPSHDAFPWGATVPLWIGDPDLKLYAKMGELNYSKMRGDQAKATLRAHPDVFLRHTLLRIQFFWFGVPHTEQKHRSEEVGRILSYSFLSVAGLLGLALALKRKVPGSWLMASVLLLTPLVYYLVVIQARFRHPIEPIIAVLSVYLFRSTTPRKTAA
jgi:hypothetical protein